MRKGYFSSHCFDNLHFSFFVLYIFNFFGFSLNTVKEINNSWNQTFLFPLWRIQGMEDESWKTSGSGSHYHIHLILCFLVLLLTAINTEKWFLLKLYVFYGLLFFLHILKVFFHFLYHWGEIDKRMKPLNTSWESALAFHPLSNTSSQ